MLVYALMFLIVALIAGVLGFSGVAVAATWGSQLLFALYLLLFLGALATGRRPPG